MKKILCLSVLFMLIAGITNIVTAVESPTMPSAGSMGTNSMNNTNVNTNNNNNKYKQLQSNEAVHELYETSEENIKHAQEYFNDSINFYRKLSKCAPTRFVLKDTNGKIIADDIVVGRTKKGLCNYKRNIEYKGDQYSINCIMPMSVALGYATTSMDAIEYLGKVPEKYQSSIKQRDEIAAVMNDYCKTIKK